ncbi:calcium-binding protein, partial [Massilia sp. YIM B02763]|uniref:calcium-binding protein n=1 Tax=Massilia sp. YIM B02763 TaxID=3050130 RepID=UPI0025B6F2E2
LSGAPTQAVIDGGDGNDTFYLYDRGSVQTITTGSGADTLYLSGLTSGSAVVTVTDFMAGGGGDRIDLNGIFGYLTGYAASSDPFAGGFLRLVQNGADTELQWDRTGSGDGAAWNTLFVLKGTNAAAFTLDNFNPAYNPDGSGTGLTIDGTENGESLAGTPNNDTINGLGGGDYLYGGFGNDTLDGGADSDYLQGEQGDDTLVGGAGNDTLSDNSGINKLYGGDGNDTFSLSGAPTQAVIDGGAGSDTFYLYDRGSAQTITTGSGADTLYLSGLTSGSAVMTVTDFTVGSGGDRIELGGITGYLSGYAGGDPFAAGFLHLVQNGADTELQWDRTGPSDGVAWNTLFVLKGVTASSLTADNFNPGYAPAVALVGVAPVADTAALAA